MLRSVPTDEIREHRIVMEIIVDCYNQEERAMGWYYYLEDRLNFPFQARGVSDNRDQTAATR
ncbi:MAG: calcium-binding protein [Thermodesulfobacteriota bacterium]